MKKTTPQLVLLLCAVVFGLTACNRGFQRLADSSTSQEPPVNKSDKVAIFEGNIVLTKPANESVIESPVDITGRVQGEIKTVIVQAVDATNTVFGQQEVSVGDDGQFTTTLEYDVPQTIQGVLRIFHVVGEGEQVTAEDVITTNVQFGDYVPQTVTLYFNNIEGDPDLTNCTQVFPVERQITTNNPLLSATLAALLQGTNEQEANNGFVSQIPEPTTQVAEVNLSDDGTLIIDFTSDFFATLTTDCQRDGSFAQIRQTMLQFDQITGVEFRVAGEPLTES